MLVPASILRRARVLAPVVLVILLLLAFFSDWSHNPYVPAAINGHGVLHDAGHAGSKQAVSLQRCSSIPRLIHQNYFFPQPASSTAGGEATELEVEVTTPRYKARTHTSSWQATPFVYNFYSLESARDLLPQLASKLPKSSKYTVDDYIRAWESLPLGMLRADFWRYLVLYLYGGIYADLDVKLVTDLPWSVLCDEGSRGVGKAVDTMADNTEIPGPDVDKSNPGKSALAKSIPGSGTSRIQDRRSIVAAIKQKFTSVEPLGLVVGIEGDNTVGGLVRGLQIVQWTMAARAGHPVTLCAIEHIVASSPDFLTRHVAENDIERYIMDWTGPGMWTDCVLKHVNAHKPSTTNALVEDTLHELAEPRRIHDTVILPRRAFAVLQGQADSAKDGVLVKHYFEGMWKTTWSARLWKSICIGSWC